MKVESLEWRKGLLGWNGHMKRYEMTNKKKSLGETSTWCWKYKNNRDFLTDVCRKDSSFSPLCTATNGTILSDVLKVLFILKGQHPSIYTHLYSIKFLAASIFFFYTFLLFQLTWSWLGHTFAHTVFASIKTKTWNMILHLFLQISPVLHFSHTHNNFFSRSISFILL